MLFLQEIVDEDGDVSVSSNVDQMLLAYATGPTARLEDILKQPYVDLSTCDPFMGFTALHLAAEAGIEDNVKLLLANDAPWNQLDNLWCTPGELALREGFSECYRIIFEGAVQSEYNFWYLKDKFYTENDRLYGSLRNQPWKIRNKEYLDMRVAFKNPRPDLPDDFAMVTETGVGVMMEWERPLMKETARLLCEDMGKGMSILNVGFGLGIIDSYFQSYEPVKHTIIEAHPACLEYMREKGWYDKPNVQILEGPWQKFIGPNTRRKADFSPGNAIMPVEDLGTFDVVYFDTFHEGYQGHLNFLRCIPELLSGPTARFSFFHGHCRGWKMGYEVYAEVARWHANDLGFSTKWTDFQIDPKTIWEGKENDKSSPDSRPEENAHPFKVPITIMAPTVPRRIVPGTPWMTKEGRDDSNNDGDDED